jgi:hypothetical protein
MSETFVYNNDVVLETEGHTKPTSIHKHRDLSLQESMTQSTLSSDVVEWPENWVLCVLDYILYVAFNCPGIYSNNKSKAIT